MKFSIKNLLLNNPDQDEPFVSQAKQKVYHTRGPIKTNQSVTVTNPIDVYLLFTTLLLVCIGIMMIFSSSTIMAKEIYNDQFYFLKRTILFSCLGLISMLITMYFPYQKYRKYILIILILTFFLLLMSFIPGLSHSAKGAARWIRIAGFTIQPSEIAKISLILFASHMLAKKGERLAEFKKGLLPVLLIYFLFIALILLQKDLGSSVVMFSVLLGLLFVSPARVLHIMLLIGMSLLAIIGLVIVAPYRMRRMMAFWEPWEHQLGAAYQLIQSWVAFNKGGFTGVGLGESTQKLLYLPEAHTDFIFSIIAEEFGVLGIMIIVFLYLVLISRGLRITIKTMHDSFGTYLTLGFTLLLACECFFNFFVVTGMLPTKGLALPFISYGGTSLICSMASVGIMLNISRSTKEDM